jgi:3-dehydroquinate dehydratase/shikimate dehydrogenase
VADKLLIATLVAAPSASGAELDALPAEVAMLEVRADLVGDLDPDWLRNHFRGRLLYCLRSRTAGGAFFDSREERRRRLEWAASCYDAVDLEGEGDFSGALLAQLPVERRVVSWYGPADSISHLKAEFDQLAAVPALTYRMIIAAATIREELTSLLLLQSLNRTDTMVHANGPLGYWSRLLALQLGSPAISGMVNETPGNPGEPSIKKLIADYGLPRVDPANKLFAIIGNPIFHSLSPRLHNWAYRSLNYPALFVPLRVESFEEFWREMIQTKVLDSLGLPLNGLTVASPHKEAALLKARIASDMARYAGSSNIMVRTNGSWNADTTDPEVVHMAARERNVTVKEKRAAVIGCGGAGRAIAAALAQSGAGVTLINRGLQRGQYAARLLDLPYVPLPEFCAAGYDIVVNATPVGRDDNDAPFNLDSLNEEGVVIDLVYGQKTTPLVEKSRAREQVVIDGRDVLLTQVVRQFRMMTGNEVSAATMAKVLGNGNLISKGDEHQTNAKADQASLRSAGLSPRVSHTQ